MNEDLGDTLVLFQLVVAKCSPLVLYILYLRPNKAFYPDRAEALYLEVATLIAVTLATWLSSFKFSLDVTTVALVARGSLSIPRTSFIKEVYVIVLW